MRDIYTFLHVCSLKRYNEIFQENWEKSIPLINLSKKFYIGIVGPGRLNKTDFPDNVEIYYFNEDPITKQLPTEEEFVKKSISKEGDYFCHEFPTLNLIQKTCKEHSCYVCYYHLRGVTSPIDNMAVVDQRHYMTHFNVERYDLCVNLLDQGFDATGVDLSNWPSVHFSGNFWWSKSEHVNRLLPPEDLPGIPNFYSKEDRYHRHRCEMWICSNSTGKYVELWNSGLHPSQKGFVRYPSENYRKI